MKLYSTINISSNLLCSWCKVWVSFEYIKYSNLVLNFTLLFALLKFFYYCITTIWSRSDSNGSHIRLSTSSKVWVEILNWYCFKRVTSDIYQGRHGVVFFFLLVWILSTGSLQYFLTIFVVIFFIYQAKFLFWGSIDLFLISKMVLLLQTYLMLFPDKAGRP